MSAQSDFVQEVYFLHELSKKKREAKESYRIQNAIRALQSKGYKAIYLPALKALRFNYRGNDITFFPYKGWFSGKGITSGRGLENLIKQLKNENY